MPVSIVPTGFHRGAGRFDTVPAFIDMSPAVVEAVDGRGEILMDGGVRRGTDILKALALGLLGRFVGRPMLWGLRHECPRRGNNGLENLERRNHLASLFLICQICLKSTEIW